MAGLSNVCYRHTAHDAIGEGWRESYKLKSGLLGSGVLFIQQNNSRKL